MTPWVVLSAYHLLLWYWWCWLHLMWLCWRGCFERRPFVLPTHWAYLLLMFHPPKIWRAFCSVHYPHLAQSALLQNGFLNCPICSLPRLYLSTTYIHPCRYSIFSSGQMFDGEFSLVSVGIFIVWNQHRVLYSFDVFWDRQAGILIVSEFRFCLLFH